MGKERIFLFSGNEELGFLEYILKCFEYKYFLFLFFYPRFHCRRELIPHKNTINIIIIAIIIVILILIKHIKETNIY